MSESTQTTAVDALLEALPYVQRWSGQKVVVKIGGSTLSAESFGDLAQDLALLSAVGVQVVLVHGGGAAVSALGRRLGLEPQFVEGLRVTDDSTMDVAQMVQVGSISRQFVGAIARHGGRALAVSGADGGGLLKARKKLHVGEDGEPVDLGRVGDIQSVDGALLGQILAAGFIPVIAPVAVDDSLESVNVNADEVATSVALAIGAGKLIFLSDIKGIQGPDGQVVALLQGEELRGWVRDGVVTGGMIPKARSILKALDGGIDRVTVADGAEPHAMISELLTREGVGTMVHRGKGATAKG